MTFTAKVLGVVAASREPLSLAEVAGRVPADRAWHRNRVWSSLQTLHAGGLVGLWRDGRAVRWWAPKRGRR